jgi:hypothetical protein
MAEIINFNKTRKAKTKADAGKRAQANRAKFGQTKAARGAEAVEQTRRDTLLDGARREDQ